jgi:hypothetical protein
MKSADAQIEILEKAVQDRVKLRPQFRFFGGAGLYSFKEEDFRRLVRSLKGRRCGQSDRWS